MNDQVISSRDKVEQHLIRQKARSVDADNSACMYRGENGLMCAAGCLIPDEHYKPGIERKSISRLQGGGWRDLFPADIPFSELEEWQMYHDGQVSLAKADEEDFWWNYQAWVDGDEAHHPTLFKQAMAARYDIAKEAA